MILQFHIGQAKAHVSSSSHGHDVNAGPKVIKKLRPQQRQGFRRQTQSG